MALAWWCLAGLWLWSLGVFWVRVAVEADAEAALDWAWGLCPVGRQASGWGSVTFLILSEW